MPRTHPSGWFQLVKFRLQPVEHRVDRPHPLGQIHVDAPTWRRMDDRLVQRAVALAIFEYGDVPAALDADTR